MCPGGTLEPRALYLINAVLVPKVRVDLHPMDVRLVRR